MIAIGYRLQPNEAIPIAQFVGRPSDAVQVSAATAPNEKFRILLVDEEGRKNLEAQKPLLHFGPEGESVWHYNGFLAIPHESTWYVFILNPTNVPIRVSAGAQFHAGLIRAAAAGRLARGTG
jgi:hypothetical protein